MRIAATADLHFSPANQTALRDELNKVRDDADVLVLAGDLTNYGQPSEMEPLLNALVRIRVPTIAVLGNHDYECGKEQELVKMMAAAGIKVLDGSAYERDGVGFAGTKGFVGGFGRGILTAFGEPEIKSFVRASIEEAPQAGAWYVAIAIAKAHRGIALRAYCRDRPRRGSADYGFLRNFAACRGH
jgi:Icc-related predicted phosphoesterase